MKRDSDQQSPKHETEPKPTPQRRVKRSLGARLLSGGLWMMGARMVSAVSGLLVSMLLARMLAPDQLGAYFIIASIAVTGAMLAQFGTHQAIVRLIAAGVAKSDLAGVRRSLRAVLVIALLGAVIVAGGYASGAGYWVAGSIFKSTAVQSVVGLTVVWIVMRHAQTLLAQAFRGFQDLRMAAVYEGALTQLLIASMLAVLWFIAYRPSLDNIVQVTIAAFGLTLLTGGILLRRRHLSRLPVARGIALSATARLSAPLFVSSTSFIVLGELHLWILGATSSAEQVALYGAGYRLMQLVLLPLSLVNHVIPPMVAELHAQGRQQQLMQVLRVSATLAAVPAVVVLSALMVFAEEILQLTYGEYFRNAATVLIIMAAGQAVNVLTGSPGVLLSMSDQQGMLMRASLGGGLLGVLVSLLLVNDFGAAGAAAGYAAGLAVQNIIMAMISVRWLGIKTYAGLGQLRFPLLWLREEISVRTNRSALFRLLERIFWPLEVMLCAVTRTNLIECLDVQHTSVLSKVNRAGCVGGVYFRSSSNRWLTNAGLGFSAMDANNLNCKWHASMPVNRVLLVLSGVGGDFLANQGMVLDGIAADDQMNEALRHYCAFLDSCRQHGNPVVVVTMSLPVICAEYAGTNIDELRLRQIMLTKLTLAFNRRLREWAQLHNAYLVDLDADLLDPATGVLREQYYRRGKVDNHLEPTEFSNLLCKLLAAPEFDRWLQQVKQ